MKTTEEILNGIRNHFNEMQQLQKYLLTFIEYDFDERKHFQDLINLISHQKICNDNYKMKEFLHLISEVSCNHHRSTNFYQKIDQIIDKFSDSITKNISNNEIFNIFLKNKRILLFLFSKKIINPNITTVTKLFNTENSEEIKKCFILKNDPKLKREENNKISLNINEIQKEIQKYDENKNQILKIIQNDLIDDFIKSKVDFNSTLDPPNYENYEFFKDKTPTIIQYSAYYGSLKIFKCLCSYNIELTSDLWLYAIHGRNIEIIQELNKRKVECSLEENVIESIKCHHNEIAQFIINNYKNDIQDDSNLIELHLLQKSFEFYNYEMICHRFDTIDFEANRDCIFTALCQNDYYYVIQSFLNIKNLDINYKTIHIYFYLMKMFLIFVK